LTVLLEDNGGLSNLQKKQRIKAGVNAILKRFGYERLDAIVSLPGQVTGFLGFIAGRKAPDVGGSFLSTSGRR